MNDFKRGTPVFGVFLGLVFLLGGGLIMWLGWWRTLLLVVLFALGYFLGAVKDKQGAVKSALGKVIPEKKEQTIDFRSEVRKEQEARYAQIAETPVNPSGASDAADEQNDEGKE